MITNIFKYLEYRKYLHDYYHAMKADKKGFTYREFSEKAGMKAPNFLQLIIVGKRNLKKSSIARVSEAIGHTPRQALYFRHLVLFDQAKSSEQKDIHFQKLSELRTAELKLDLLSTAQLSHYKHWYYHAIRELLGFYELYPHQRYAFRHLATMLEPAITESQAKKAVTDLLKLDLLRKEPGGRIAQNARFVTTGDEVRSYFVRSFHETMMKAAFKSQDRFPPVKRDVSSLTVSISDSGFQQMKSEIQAFRKRLLDLVRLDSDPDNVYQINFQLFPLTNPKKTAKYKRGAPTGQKARGRGV